MITLSHPVPAQRHAGTTLADQHAPHLGMTQRFRNSGAALRPIAAQCEHMVPILGPLLPGRPSLGESECLSRAFGSEPLMDPVSGRRESWAWCSFSHRSEMVNGLVRAGFRVPHQRTGS